MWYSGYCNDAVEFCSTTGFDDEGSQARVTWMKKHVPDCQECTFANFFKAMEADVAKELGLFDVFLRGGDISTHPGHRDAVHRRMMLTVEAGLIDPAIQEWLTRVVKRREAPWPGRAN